MRKRELLNTIVCRNFCSYYKPGVNEELSCGGYDFVFRLVQEGRRVEVAASASSCTADETEMIIARVCSQCSFREDGCDFILDRKAPPCGGVRLISQLLAQRMLQAGDLQ